MKKLTNVELLERSLSGGIGALIEDTSPDQIQDEELQEDWREASFLITRIYRRLTDSGEFTHAGC